jgi:hypothetical protein
MRARHAMTSASPRPTTTNRAWGSTLIVLHPLPNTEYPPHPYRLPVPGLACSALIRTERRVSQPSHQEQNRRSGRSCQSFRCVRDITLPAIVCSVIRL